MGDGFLPPLPESPWAPGEEPFGLSVDLEEYPAILLGLRRCRSFRADLRHKLEIILRSHGGYGNGGQARAARELGVHRHTLHEWCRWARTPAGRWVWEKIDNVYERALERLALEASKKARRD